MDEIKMEPEVDLLGLPPHDNTWKTEESKVLSEERNLSNLQVGGMKTECVDHSYDLTSEIKVEDTPVPINFPVVKSEVNDTSMHISSPTLKSEVVEDLFDVDRVKQEQKVELSSEEDEVLTESVVGNVEKTISQMGIDREEDMLPQCGSNRPDCSNISDISHNSMNLCNEVVVTPEFMKLHFHTDKIKKLFKCKVCGKCFLKLSDIQRHALLHTSGTPFHCDVCGNSFRKLWVLKRHERIHTKEKPFKCDVCGKCFSGSSYLKKHSRIHTGYKRYLCDICGECFSHSMYLKSHTRVHTGDKPFKCELCGLFFSQVRDLHQHVTIHTGERPFKCDLCGRFFSKQGHLQQHVRIHTGERPFKCDLCGRFFSKQGHLRQHVCFHK
ncbi:zinc finger protein 501-like [Periplaneta americana]|uniref:zinc finger protein 501-like n=1 Tax=Periplaneta americana TaxID=6978 RepID=UPI0037E90E78